MKPTQFPESTKTLQRPDGMTEQECGPLPVYNDGTQSVSCWQMTWRERFSALFFGRVWLTVVFGYTQPPVALDAKKTIFEKPQPYHISGIREYLARLQCWWIDKEFDLRVWLRSFRWIR